MNDLELLFLVLAVLYCWECACWVPRGSVAFLTWFGRRWRAAHPGNVFGNPRGGFVFATPLPPFGTFLTGSQFPLSLSPEAALAYVAPSVNPGSRPAQTGVCLRLEQVRSVETSGKKVLVDSQILLKVVSPTQAIHLAGQLQQLSRLPPGKRAAAIEKMARAGFDRKAIEERWLEFQQRAAGLRLLNNLLFVYVFILAPLLIWHFGLQRCWLELLLGLLCFTSSTAFLFRRAHRTLYPDASEERFTHFLTILLAPATTMRAHDILSRPLLEDFHPLAIAKVFCPDRDFHEFAARFWRELHYPALPVCPNPDSVAQATERHFRAVLQVQVKDFLQQCGLSVEVLTAPPPPADDVCRAYCPRCLAQFTTVEGVCSDCGGLPLLPLGSPGPGMSPTGVSPAPHPSRA